MEKLATYVVRQGALSSDDAVGWIVRLSATLEPLHAVGLSHGCISARAVQIESPSCQSGGWLLDAHDLTDDPAYFSVERASGGTPSPSDDAWALGVTLYRMLTGELPFGDGSAEGVKRRILSAPASPLAVFDVGDDQLQAVLDRLFTRDPRQRLMRMSQLRALLLSHRPHLTGLPPLRYGQPEGEIDDEDSSAAATTAVWRFHGGDASAALAEARRRLLGPETPPSSRRVRPPPKPRDSQPLSVSDTPQVDASSCDVLLDSSSGLQVIDRESAAPATRPSAPPRESQPRESRPLPYAPPPHGTAPPAHAAPRFSARVTPTDLREQSSLPVHVASMPPRAAPRQHTLLMWVLGTLCVLVGAAAAYLTLGGAEGPRPAPPASERQRPKSAPVPGTSGVAPAASPIASASSSASAGASSGPRAATSPR